MSKTLVIVESPAKAKKIQEYLGKDYIVRASFGHIRDLKPDELSVDLDTFKPIYEIMKDKAKVIKELKSADAKNILLAADPDREGESIAYHLAYILGLKLSDTNRITFHEITKNAILKAVGSPRKIDINLVNAYQARRVLDRVVGYKISPILWKSFDGKLSAGRVQSVALRMIVEREKEIEAFVPEEKFVVDGKFDKNSDFGLSGRLNKEYTLTDDVKKFLQHCKDATFKIAAITPSESIRNPPAPFTTSSLQQDAGAKFGFSTKQTMTTAQKLYEAGKITYMRTDSTTLSQDALEEIKKVIIEGYTEEYLNIKQYKTKSKNAQEAHEAIRPTNFEEKELSDDFDEQQKKLYSLIWKRTVASQMKACIMSVLTVDISITNVPEKFISRLEKVKFDGYTVLYQDTSLDESEESDINELSNWDSLKVGTKLQREVITATQKESKPPGRFTEPMLVKRLEEKGIGRPSTYASIITTIIEREYTKKMNIPGVKKEILILTLKKNIVDEKKKNITVGSEKGKLIPTTIGKQVSDFLSEKFPEIMDYSFTANVEKELDNITKGKIEWEKVVGNTWDTLKKEISEIDTDSFKNSRVRELGTDSSGKKVLARITKNGPALQIDKKFRSITDEEYEKITLAEAIKKFEEGYPQDLGQNISIHQGQYGFYLKSGNKNYSIESPEITLEEAKKLIEEKNSNVIKVGKKSYQLLNGKYGWYLKDGKNNISLPESIRKKCPNITADDIRELVEKKTN
jgi:DNA topoisomerase-1